MNALGTKTFFVVIVFCASSAIFASNGSEYFSPSASAQNARKNAYNAAVSEIEADLSKMERAPTATSSSRGIDAALDRLEQRCRACAYRCQQISSWLTGGLYKPIDKKK